MRHNKTSHEDQPRFNQKRVEARRPGEDRYLRNALRSDDIRHLCEYEGDDLWAEQDGVFEPQVSIRMGRK